MSRIGSARRYAQAAFDLAQSSDDLDRWLEDMQVVEGVLGVGEVKAFLKAPSIPLAEKEGLLREQLSSVGSQALNLACLLVRRQRVHLAKDIVHTYQEMMDAHRGVVRAVVTTAVPLDQEQESAVKVELQRRVRKDVILSLQVDPEILGGLVARIGDKLLDGSVRAQLQEIKHRLKTGIG